MNHNCELLEDATIDCVLIGTIPVGGAKMGKLTGNIVSIIIKYNYCVLNCCVTALLYLK